jgi:hypothetical protein
MSHAGLDLSRRRLDVCLLSDRGSWWSRPWRAPGAAGGCRVVGRSPASAVGLTGSCGSKTARTGPSRLRSPSPAAGIAGAPNGGARSGPGVAPSRKAALPAVRLRWQPGGLACTVRIGKGLDADDPPIADGQERRSSLIDFELVRPADDVYDDRYLVTSVIEPQ